MPRTVNIALVLSLLALFSVGCGSDDPAGPGGNGNGGGGVPSGNFIKGDIDGTAFQSTGLLTTLTGINPGSAAGQLILTGIDGTGFGMTLILSFIKGPGTYPLGTNNNTTAAGIGQVVNISNSWSTPLSGSAGTVTISERSANRIAGTFSFVADLLNGTGAATTTVTNGSFSYTDSQGLPPLPTGESSTFEATIDDAAWTGATVVAVFPSAGIWGLTATNDVYNISVTPLTAVTAGNTYGIPSQVALRVTGVETITDLWAASAGPDVGSITITAIDGTSAAGTFSATLPPAATSTATEPLEITNGSFSVYEF